MPPARVGLDLNGLLVLRSARSQLSLGSVVSNLPFAPARPDRTRPNPTEPDRPATLIILPYCVVVSQHITTKASPAERIAFRTACNRKSLIRKHTPAS